MLVYNANFNLYCLASFLIELSPAGVMSPSYTMQTIQMDLYNNFDQAYLVPLILEMILYVRLLYTWLNEFQEVYATYQADGSILGYFKDAWNLMDWSLIVLSFLALAMRIMFVYSPRVINFDPFATEYLEVSQVAGMYNNSFILDALAAFFGIFKIFRCKSRRSELTPSALRAEHRSNVSTSPASQTSSCSVTCISCASRSSAASLTSPSSQACS